MSHQPNPNIRNEAADAAEYNSKLSEDRTLRQEASDYGWKHGNRAANLRYRGEDTEDQTPRSVPRDMPGITPSGTGEDPFTDAPEGYEARSTSFDDQGNLEVEDRTPELSDTDALDKEEMQSFEGSGSDGNGKFDENYKPTSGGMKPTPHTPHTQRTQPTPQQTPQQTPQNTQPATGPVTPGRVVGINTHLTGAVDFYARLPPCDLGAVELCTFFPNHTQWPEPGLRLLRNGWKYEDIAMAQLHARNNVNKAYMDRRKAALRQQALANGKNFFNDESFTPTSRQTLMTPVNTYDATNYRPKSTVNMNRLTDATLLELGNGIHNWPTGADRGIVTQCIEHAVQNNDQTLMVRDIPRLAQQLGFAMPAEATGTQWDQRANHRVRIIVTGYGYLT